MNSVIADFVGLLGPGQVVDRHALVAVPAGFLKVKENITCFSVSVHGDISLRSILESTNL